MIKRRSTIIFLFLLFVARLGISDPTKMPPVETDVQKMTLLAAIQRIAPELFTGTVNIDFDRLDILEKQAELLSKLMNLPEYREMMAARGPYQTLTFSTQPPTQPKELSPGNLALMRFRLTGALKQIGTGDFVKNVEETIQNKSREIEGGGINGYLVGLINTLPQSIRSSVFAMPLKEKLEALRQNLPADLASSGFRMGQFKIEGNTFSKDQALALLMKKIEANDLLLNSLLLKTFAETFQKTDSEGVTHSVMAALTEPGDKDAIEAVMRKLADRAQSDKRYQIAEKDFKSVYAKTEETQKPQFPSKKIILREVPPYVAIFRGCAGGDCSSAYSFGYPWSPKERVYLVYDEEGGLKGYVSGTLLESAGKKSFYIHTIQGARISGQDTEQILHGFYSGRDKMGVEQILLPQSDQISSNVNYSGIQEVMTSHTSESPEVPLTYLDARVRAILDSYSSADYDKVATNTKGHIYVPKEDGSPKVNFSTADAKIPTLEEIPVSKGDAILLALDFIAAGKKAVANRVLKAAGVKVEEYRRIRDALQNKQKLKTKPFYERLTKLFGEIGLKLTDNFVEHRSYLFADGHFRSPDAFTGEFAKRGMKMVAAQLDNPEADHSPILALAKKHKSEFENNERFLNLFIRKVMDKETPENFATDFLEAGIPKEFDRRILEWLRSQLPDLRERAISLLDADLFPNLASEIIELLKTPEKLAAGEEAGLIQALAHLRTEENGTTIERDLVERLSSPDLKVREYAARALASFKAISPTSRLALVAALYDANPSVHIHAGKALNGEVLDPALRGQFLAGLEDPRPSVRAAFVHASGTRGAELEKVKQLLSDPSPIVRRAASEVFSLQLVENKEIHDKLAALVSDPDSEIRVHVTKALAQFKTVVLDLQTYIKLLNDADPIVRKTALEFIGIRVSTPQILAAIAERFLTETEPKLLTLAATKLSEYTGAIAADLQEKFLKAFTSPNVKVREAVTEILSRGSLSEASLALLLKLTHHELPFIRANALTVLAQNMNNKGATARAFSLMSDPNAQVRRNAIVALASLHSGKVESRILNAWVKALSDPFPEVRAAASDALAQSQVTGLENLVKAATLSDNESVRLKAIETLGNSRAPEAHEALAFAINDPIPENRSAAIRALWAAPRRDPKYEKLLISTIDDPEEEVRDIAWEVIQENKRPSLELIKRLVEIYRDSAHDKHQEARSVLEEFVPKSPELQAPVLELLKGEKKLKLLGLEMVQLWISKRPELAASVMGLIEDQDPQIKSLAVSTLESIERPSEAVKFTMAKLLLDPSRETRLAATRVLHKGRIRDPKTIELIREALKSRNAEIREGAIGLYVEKHLSLDAEIEALLIKMLSSKNPRIVSRTLELLARVESPTQATIDGVTALMKRGVPNESQKIISLLARWGADRNVWLPKIQEGLTGTNYENQRNALTAISKLKPLPAEIQLALVGIIRKNRANPKEVRNQYGATTLAQMAANTLGTVARRTKASDSALVDILSEIKDPEVHVLVLRVLRAHPTQYDDIAERLTNLTKGKSPLTADNKKVLTDLLAARAATLDCPNAHRKLGNTQ